MSTGIENMFSSVTPDALKKANKAISAGRRGYYKWEDGVNLLRVLPGLPGQDPWVIYQEHYIANWGGGDKALKFICPRAHGGGRCPACEHADKLRASGNPADAKKASKFDPKTRVAVYVIDRKNEEGGPLLAQFGSQVFEQMHELLSDEDMYGQDFTHPLSGDDLAIKRGKNKKSGYIEYKVNISNKSRERLAESDEQIIKWLEFAQRKPIAGFVKLQTYEQIMHEAATLEAEAKGVNPPPPLDSSKQLPEGQDMSSGGAGSQDFGENTVESDMGDESGQTAETPF